MNKNIKYYYIFSVFILTPFVSLRAIPIKKNIIAKYKINSIEKKYLKPATQPSINKEKSHFASGVKMIQDEKIILKTTNKATIIIDETTK